MYHHRSDAQNPTIQALETHMLESGLPWRQKKNGLQLKWRGGSSLVYIELAHKHDYLKWLTAIYRCQDLKSCTQQPSSATALTRLMKRRVSFKPTVSVKSIPKTPKEHWHHLFYTHGDFVKFSQEAGSVTTRTNDFVRGVCQEWKIKAKLLRSKSSTGECGHASSSPTKVREQKLNRQSTWSPVVVL